MKGIGELIALTYVLTIEEPQRFRKSRDVKCFVKLQPGRRNSGESEPQMPISKAGDEYLRTLLVQGAHSSSKIWPAAAMWWPQSITPTKPSNYRMAPLRRRCWGAISTILGTLTKALLLRKEVRLQDLEFVLDGLRENHVWGARLRCRISGCEPRQPAARPAI